MEKKDLGSLGEGAIIRQCPIFFPLSNGKTVCSLAHGPQQFDSGVPACDARWMQTIPAWIGGSIPSRSVSGRSHLRLCQATCKVLLSADVLAPAGLV